MSLDNEIREFTLKTVYKNDCILDKYEKLLAQKVPSSGVELKQYGLCFVKWEADYKIDIFKLRGEVVGKYKRLMTDYMETESNMEFFYELTKNFKKLEGAVLNVENILKRLFLKRRRFVPCGTIEPIFRVGSRSLFMIDLMSAPDISPSLKERLVMGCKDMSTDVFSEWARSCLFEASKNVVDSTWADARLSRWKATRAFLKENIKSCKGVLTPKQRIDLLKPIAIKHYREGV